YLSCVKMTGQVFGTAHIIAILRGSRADRLLARGHDRLSTFGTGKAHTVGEWRALAQEFLRLALLDQGLEFGGLRLTPKGWDVLQGNERVLIPLGRAQVARLAQVAPQRHNPSSILRPATRRRFHEIGRLFTSGQSIEQIAQHYDIQPETVIEHL